MRRHGFAFASAVVLGALCARGGLACTDSTVLTTVPMMGYEEQACLSIASPLGGTCFAIGDPTTETVPLTLDFGGSFNIRPPGACSANGLFNCGHVQLYLDGVPNTQSSSFVSDLDLQDLPLTGTPSEHTITALLVDDCGNPWTLDWNDAGVVEDGGIMCQSAPDGSAIAPADGGTFTPALPAGALQAGSTTPCPQDGGMNPGPYFASVTILLAAGSSCPDAGDGG
jgi:hypothetical protein